MPSRPAPDEEDLVLTFPSLPSDRPFAVFSRARQRRQESPACNDAPAHEDVAQDKHDPAVAPAALLIAIKAFNVLLGLADDFCDEKQPKGVRDSHGEAIVENEGGVVGEGADSTLMGAHQVHHP
ncbi:hypothetical protein OF846_002698 [Rhodotorula toruloides]|nr:hypothetical protein OF846_002698 [Rhodotorula toruloides]